MALSVPEGIPHTGIYTSDQGMVSILDQELLRIQRGSITIDNNVNVYRESHKRTGITYAGIQRVTGTITRALVNAAFIKLVMGDIPANDPGDDDFVVGPRVISNTQLETLLQKLSLNQTERHYPPFIDIQLIVNPNELPQVDSSQQVLAKGGMHILTAYKAKIINAAFAWDARGLITTGPINFLATSARWEYQLPE